MPRQPRLPAPRPPTALPGPLSLSLRSAGTQEASPATRRTNPSIPSSLCLLKSRPTPPSTNHAPRPSRRAIQSRVDWAPASRPSCAPRRLRGRLRWASAFSQRRWECRLRRCCSRGAGQRRRAPPAGREGASASPGPAVRDPGLRRRRRSCCPGPSARREGSRPDVPGRECPRRTSWRGPQSSRPPSECALSLPGLTCPGRLAPRCGGVCARGRLPRPPARRGRGRLPPSASPVSRSRSVSPVRPPCPVARRELP